MSVEARHILPKERLLDIPDEVRKNREIERSLFSTTQRWGFFCFFFKGAYDYFSDYVEIPADLIQASRKPDPVAFDLEEHIMKFIKHAKDLEELTDFAILIMHLAFSCPPDTHRKSVLVRN